MNKVNFKIQKFLIPITSLVIVAFAIFFIVSSCVDKSPEQIKRENEDIAQKRSTLVDLTFNGETHEYVFYHRNFGDSSEGGLAHWEGCKYCKH